MIYMKRSPVTYDFPANELVRVCMGLEFYARRLESLVESSSPQDQVACWDIMAKILLMLERHDLRNKFIRFFRSASHYLKIFLNYPNVDKHFIDERVDLFNRWSLRLYEQESLLAEGFLANPFLQMLKHRIGKQDMAAIDYTCPYMQCWLQSGLESRDRDLRLLLKQLSTLFDLSKMVLCFLRENKAEIVGNSENGYFQYNHANLSQQLYLIGVHLQEDDVVPVATISHKNVFLRFFYMDKKGKFSHFAKPVLRRVSFNLVVGVV